MFFTITEKFAIEYLNTFRHGDFDVYEIAAFLGDCPITACALRFIFVFLFNYQAPIYKLGEIAAAGSPVAFDFRDVKILIRILAIQFIQID